MSKTKQSLSKPSLDATVKTALSLFQSGDIEATISTLETGIAAFRHSRELRLLLGQAHFKKGDFDAAAAAYRTVVESNPRDGDALFGQAIALAQGSAPESAIPILDKLIQARPDMAELQYNRGLALRACNRLESAEQAYRSAMKINPGLVATYRNLGNLLLDLGRVDEAFAIYHEGFLRRRQRGVDPANADLRSISAAKLKHDIEQLEHLSRQGKLGPDDEDLIDGFRSVHAEIAAVSEAREVPLSNDQLHRLGGVFQRILYLDPGERISGGVIQQGLDAGEIEKTYLDSRPNLAVIDDVLVPDAIEGLRRFLADSTIWHRWRFVNDNGYMGAMMDDGFDCPLILQISEDLRSTFPRVFKEHTLRKVWAFKYAETIGGVPAHADFAAVNLNLYITPDEANLEPKTGGLLVWDVVAPLEWGFERYNTDEAALSRLVEERGKPPLRLPHRQNRIVMFDSDLVHATDQLHFKPGYLNRRINVTMLFGKREND
ncbi:MAG: tetratricopeptide repeat protein [Rhodospirillaceae bacterium]|nr:tetratricopeptide repeat protein [Rhodospirillaceae bacterium]